MFQNKRTFNLTDTVNGCIIETRWWSAREGFVTTITHPNRTKSYHWPGHRIEEAKDSHSDAVLRVAEDG